MSKQANGIFPISITATTTLTEKRFVTFAGAVPAAGANTLGVVRQNAVSGDKVTVDTLGTAIVTAGAAITAGATVQADASGNAITYSSGAKVGIAMQSASTLGDFIEVFLLQNVA